MIDSKKFLVLYISFVSPLAINNTLSVYVIKHSLISPSLRVNAPVCRVLLRYLFKNRGDVQQSQIRLSKAALLCSRSLRKDAVVLCASCI